MDHQPMEKYTTHNNKPKHLYTIIHKVIARS